MALDWDGFLIKVVDAGADSYETRLHRQIFFGGIVLLGLIIAWKVIK
jgi:hypothetical protein